MFNDDPMLSIYYIYIYILSNKPLNYLPAFGDDLDGIKHEMV